jgi:tRNA threonylcarbamoyladenosine biosynthesis protein TsaB
MNMRVLALDTTTRSGSVALLDNDRVVEERPGDAARAQVERLPHELIALAEAHDVALADIDLFAVATGPGSFTGLRIGIAIVQGLAFVHGKRIAGVSALDAAAHVAGVDARPDSVIAAWMDAHRREIFGALYRVTAAPLFDPARLTTIEEASVGDPIATLRRWRSALAADTIFVGDGALMHADVIAREIPSMRSAGAPLLAGAIGRLASAHARQGLTVTAAGIQPLYVRRPDVELARERAK